MTMIPGAEWYIRISQSAVMDRHLLLKTARIILASNIHKASKQVSFQSKSIPLRPVPFVESAKLSIIQSTCVIDHCCYSIHLLEILAIRPTST